MNTLILQTVFKAAIGRWVRGRCQNGVSDGKLTRVGDKMWITLSYSQPVDNLIDCERCYRFKQ